VNRRTRRVPEGEPADEPGAVAHHAGQSPLQRHGVHIEEVLPLIHVPMIGERARVPYQPRVQNLGGVGRPVGRPFGTDRQAVAAPTMRSAILPYSRATSWSLSGPASENHTDTEEAISMIANEASLAESTAKPWLAWPRSIVSR
jgi:hypothetical protein